MTADIVYEVAKALPKKEQIRLLEKLRQDFKLKKPKSKELKPIMNEQEAMDYLLKNVFKVDRN